MDLKCEPVCICVCVGGVRLGGVGEEERRLKRQRRHLYAFHIWISYPHRTSKETKYVVRRSEKMKEKKLLHFLSVLMKLPLLLHSANQWKIRSIW